MRQKARSNPELGKCVPSLPQVVCRAPQRLRPAEVEAERLFYSLFTLSVGKREFCIYAKDLARRDPVAGAYVFWLVKRHYGDQFGGQRWPKVAPLRKGPMRMLELFKGTGSIGRAFEERGWEVTSLDCHPKWKATHTCDILKWDYKVYGRDHFTCIWASPCCTHYSKARTTGGSRDLEYADSLVRKVLEVIRYFHTASWAFENPQTGLLPGRDVVRGLPFVDTTYCRYEGYEYRKPTRIWTNLPLELRPICTAANPCEHRVGGKHPKTAQQSRRKGEAAGVNQCSQAQLFSIPPAMCDEVAEAAIRFVAL
jgi:hypothetical protein